MKPLIPIEVSPDEVNFDSNIIKDELCPLLWTKQGELREDVKERLLDIGNRFYRFLGADVELQDILFTGSLCNYNYNEDSDIDIHVVVNFAELGDPEVVRGLLQAKKFAFNTYREGTTIKGFPIECYFQDVESREPHHPSGLYSLLTGWKIKSQKVKLKFKEKKVRKLLASFINLINHLEHIEDNQEKLERAIEIKDFIVQMRREAVREHGEFCEANLCYKQLRRDGVLDKLFTTIRACMDKKLSLEQSIIKGQLLKENFTTADERQVRVWIRQELDAILKKGELTNQKAVREIVKDVLKRLNKWNFEKANVWMSGI